MKLTKWMFAACAVLTLAACGGDNKSGNTGKSTGSVPGSTFEMMGMGDKNAPATLVEYASVTCSHCAAFHQEVWPSLKKRVDAGELRFEFREFPTPPVPVAVAGFRIARCTGGDKYFEVLDDLFASQMDILMASRQGVVKTALQTVAERHGLNKEQFEVCIRDKKLLETIEKSMQEADAKGVTGTPAFFLNGKQLTKREDTTAAGLNALIDELNGIEPSEAPAEETAPEASDVEDAPHGE